MRFAIDTGGTFTDLLVEGDDGRLEVFKAPTTPDDPVRGVLDVLTVAAQTRGMTLHELLRQGSTLIHGTTRAINAILTGATARTAFLTTWGHPDILVFREGGRSEPFDNTRPYPEPYVPRSLTFEVPERIGADGSVVLELDEAAVVAIAGELATLRVETVAVCLLWSIVNPTHELRVGALLDEHLPGVPYTLSHQLNPAVREYRRASSTAIDASLKPLMSGYLRDLEARLRDAGFGGRVLVVTSNGGMARAADVAAAPIHTINSGPALAPVAGQHVAARELGATSVIVADAGGTSYDVSLVRGGRIPMTRESWIGPRFFGHMTGFPMVDVRSVGAGGGSLAWVDEGGLLHVGPRSAGAVPGPACYGRGGTRPTVTDACLVLGYLDPDTFLDGTLRLDPPAAEQAVREHVAQPLGLESRPAAGAILALATEHMVQAIEEITVRQGIDPSTAVFVGGGGAAGFNAVAVARRLGCRRLIIPGLGAVLSASGMLLSELTADFHATLVAHTDHFDTDGVNRVLAELHGLCVAFVTDAGSDVVATAIELAAEARYPHQVWDLEVPLRAPRFSTPDDLAAFRDDFHAVHQEVFAVHDPHSAVEAVGWRARARVRLHAAEGGKVMQERGAFPRSRQAWFPDQGLVESKVYPVAALPQDEPFPGPLIIDAAYTTVVVDGASTVRRTRDGNLVLDV